MNNQSELFEAKLLSIEEKLTDLSEAEQDILKVIEISLQTSQYIQENIPFTATNNNNNKLLDLSNDLITTLQNIRNKIILQTDILNPTLEINTSISENNTLVTNNTKPISNNKQQEVEDSFLLKQLNSLDSN